MKQDKDVTKKINQVFVTTMVTWFGCGRAPFAPGTFGSIGALPFCWVLALYAPWLYRIPFLILIFALAVWSAALEQRSSRTRDPSYVVIDEVAGMFFATALTSAQWPSFLVAFLLFRFFDVVKVFPANLFDRRSKTEPSASARGVYIVLDDIVAGCYSAAVLQILKMYFSFLA